MCLLLSVCACMHAFCVRTHVYLLMSDILFVVGQNKVN